MGFFQRMMFIFLTLIILGSHGLSHGRPPLPRKLNKETYLAHVKPILHGIFNNFYQMLSLFPDYPKELLVLLKEVESLESDKKILLHNCPRLITAKCKATTNSIRAKLLNIEALTFKILRSPAQSYSFYLNHLSGLNLISTFQSKVSSAKGLLDNSSFFQVAEIKFKRPSQTLIKMLDELETYVVLSLLEFIPFSYRDDFRQFYFNFIHPLNLQFPRETATNFIGKNINKLNFAINLFHQTLTKRKKPPKAMSPHLYLIHGRWNNLLRYYM